MEHKPPDDAASRAPAVALPKARAEKSGRLLGIQMLRGLAATSVMLHHLLEIVQPSILPDRLPMFLDRLTDSGVDLFFVVSGFIMFRTTKESFGREGAAVQFLIKRLIRIIPPYWFCTIAIAFANFKAWPVSFYKILMSLFFIPVTEPLYGVGWTLNYEMYFYLIFAVWLKIGTASRALFAIPLTILALITIGTVLTNGEIIYGTRPPRVAGFDFLAYPIAMEFAFGLLIAWASLRWPPKFPKMTAAFGTCCLVFASVLDISDASWETFRVIAFGIPVAILVYSSVLIARVRHAFAIFLLHLGDASYAIYLTHVIVIVACLRITHLLNLPPASQSTGWVVVFFIAVACLAAGILAYRFAERPFALWLKQRWGQRKGVVDAAVSPVY